MAERSTPSHRLPWPIEVGTLRAGEWASSVPERLVCEGRYGFAPGEDEAAAKRALEEAIAAVAAADRVAARSPAARRVVGRPLRARRPRTPADPLVARSASAAGAVLGEAAPLEGVTYGSDMRLLVNVGRMPAVLFGPGDVRDCHMPDESVAVDEVRLAARALIVTAMRFCGVLDAGGEAKAEPDALGAEEEVAS